MQNILQTIFNTRNLTDRQTVNKNKSVYFLKLNRNTLEFNNMSRLRGLRFYSNIPEIVPGSTRRVFKRRKITKEEPKPIEEIKNHLTEYRENEFKIQMLSRNLYQQIFKHAPEKMMSDRDQFEK